MRDTVTRHGRVCRYWANKDKSGRRGTSCQNLHKSIKKLHEVFQHNHSILDVETCKEANIEDNNENKTHVKVSLEEDIRKTVINILEEMN